MDMAIIWGLGVTDGNSASPTMPTFEAFPVTRIVRPGAKKRGPVTPGYGCNFRRKKSTVAEPTVRKFACRMK